MFFPIPIWHYRKSFFPWCLVWFHALMGGCMQRPRSPHLRHVFLMGSSCVESSACWVALCRGAACCCAQFKIWAPSLAAVVAPWCGSSGTGLVVAATSTYMATPGPVEHSGGGDPLNACTVVSGPKEGGSSGMGLFICFLGLHPRHMYVPRLGVQSEL